MSLPDTLAAIAASGLPLQGKLDILKTEFETKLAPPAIVAALHRATDELVAAHAADKALKAGGRAPVFILSDTNGKPISSKELLARGPLIISFYRGVPILSDAGGEVSAQFGVRWTVPGYLRDIHKQLGADLTQFNGEDSWTLPMPARYVIGQDGIIAYAEVNPDYTHRPEPSDAFPVLDALRAWRGA